MRDFKKLQIWIDGIEQVISTYTITRSFPPEEKFALSKRLFQYRQILPKVVVGIVILSSSVSLKCL
jgi:hypothetical protein